MGKSAGSEDITLFFEQAHPAPAFHRHNEPTSVVEEAFVLNTQADCDAVVPQHFRVSYLFPFHAKHQQLTVVVHSKDISPAQHDRKPQTSSTRDSALRTDA